MTQRVVHFKRAPFDVRCTRPYKWGNPFVVPQDGQRLQVIEKHKHLLLSHPRLVDEARAELAGKVLGCWCFPLPCHCDTLAKIANSVPVPHQKERCAVPCDHTYCNELYVCRHCRGAEGALTSECPRTLLKSKSIDKIYNGELNFICGEWIDGAYLLFEGEKHYEKRNMPFWCGRVYCED